MRRRLYFILNKNNIWYDSFMVPLILVSLLPLMLMEPKPWSTILEQIVVSIFIIDYFLRWSVADIQLKKGSLSFLIYPITPMAVIDSLSIIPCFTMLNNAFKVTRIIRILRIFRIFKFLHHSRHLKAFTNVLYKERQVLGIVLLLSVFYIFITALILFNVEPHINPNTGEPTFYSFLDALYWATVTLTTVGYGDLCPITDAGRIVSMLSAFFGIAVIALPSGVITASYLEELRKN